MPIGSLINWIVDMSTEGERVRKFNKKRQEHINTLNERRNFQEKRAEDFKKERGADLFQNFMQEKGLAQKNYEKQKMLDTLRGTREAGSGGALSFLKSMEASGNKDLERNLKRKKSDIAFNHKMEMKKVPKKAETEYGRISAKAWTNIADQGFRMSLPFLGR